MVRIKICGITNFDDARTAANLDVDALGFIFYSKSPRCVDPLKVREIVGKLPPFVSRVGVFVDEDFDKMINTCRTAGIDTVQLHGKESPDYCSRVPFPVIKAFSVEPSTDLSGLSLYNVAGFLLDTWHADKRGGTGMAFDWTIAKRACLMYGNIILAGGLGPSNLLEAIDAVEPYGVDVNSGVEIKPGIKNPHKMREAINIVKNWRRSTPQPEV